jgi:hypothetical protein
MKPEDIKIPTEQEVELIQAQKAEMLDIPRWAKPLQWNSISCEHLEHVEIQRVYHNGNLTRWRLCTSCFTGSAKHGNGEGLRRITSEEIERVQEYHRCLSFIESNASLLAEAKTAALQGVKDYKSYLLSDEWREKRRLIINRCGSVCEGCGLREAEEVHHITYDHIYNEFLFQLLGLCSLCHRKWHETMEHRGVPKLTD